jgi:hypothetical protein
MAALRSSEALCFGYIRFEPSFRDQGADLARPSVFKGRCQPCCPAISTFRRQRGKARPKRGDTSDDLADSFIADFQAFAATSPFVLCQTGRVTSPRSRQIRMAQEYLKPFQ